MTHDYKRHGTTTLFAALNVLDGTVIGRNMQRHRHQEFIRFLNAIEAEVPAGKVIHVILDNYAAHKHPIAVDNWMASLIKMLGGMAMRRAVAAADMAASPAKSQMHPHRTDLETFLASECARRHVADARNVRTFF
jgi:hypothetical protein